MSKSKVFHNGNDWCIGESAEDAMAVWQEYTGEDWREDYGDVAEWERVPDNEVLPIRMDGEPHARDVPEGATVENDDGIFRIVTTASEWAKHNGRGWLCSLDW